MHEPFRDTIDSTMSATVEFKVNADTSVTAFTPTLSVTAPSQEEAMHRFSELLYERVMNGTYTNGME